MNRDFDLDLLRKEAIQLEYEAGIRRALINTAIERAQLQARVQELQSEIEGVRAKQEYAKPEREPDA